MEDPRLDNAKEIIKAHGAEWLGTGESYITTSVTDRTKEKSLIAAMNDAGWQVVENNDEGFVDFADVNTSKGQSHIAKVKAEEGTYEQRFAFSHLKIDHESIYYKCWFLFCWTEKNIPLASIKRFDRRRLGRAIYDIIRFYGNDGKILFWNRCARRCKGCQNLKIAWNKGGKNKAGALLAVAD